MLLAKAPGKMVVLRTKMECNEEDCISEENDLNFGQLDL